MSQPDVFHSFTKTPHKHTYPALSPSLPQHSAKGKTVIICGGSQGIGLEIAKSFAVAEASALVLLARNETALVEAKKSIETEHATKVHTYPIDISDLARVTAIIPQIEKEVADPDILVLSASILHTQNKVFDVSIEDLSSSLAINVTSNFVLVKAFLKDHVESPGAKQKVIVNLSSVVAHMNFPGMSAYGAGKVALLSMLGHVHDEYAAKGVSVRSFHPGSIYTTLLEKHGMANEFWPWDDIDLAAHFCVWLASDDAAFLSGRYVWAQWDIDELKARAEEIKSSPYLLKIGLIGEPAADQGEYI